MMMIIVKKAEPPERLRLPPVQPHMQSLPPRPPPLPLRTIPAFPSAAAAAAAVSREGLRVLLLSPRAGSRTAPVCALPGSAWGLGGGRAAPLAPGRVGRGGCLPQSACLPCLGRLGSRLQSQLLQVVRSWWLDCGSTSYLVNFPFLSAVGGMLPS